MIARSYPMCARLLIAAVVWCAGLATGSQAQVAEREVANQLRRTLENTTLPLQLELGGETVIAALALPAFYEGRVYQPAWVGPLGPRPEAMDLVEFLATVELDGLRPEDYHLQRLRELLSGLADGSAEMPVNGLVELDLLLTDAFLMSGAHLVSGRVDPTSLDREWLAVRREVDLVELLERALGEGEIHESLVGLLPDHDGYLRLRELGEAYRGLIEAGGWPSVSDGPTLRPGDDSPRVVELRARLRVTDGLEPGDEGPSESVFDEVLEAAVERFQERHGLDADGVVGVKTLEVLNVSAAARLEQIYLNLERWRWLPRDLGDHYVLVNLPAFGLRVVDKGETLIEMRVAIGRRYRRTPVFSDTIRYLVFNPYWEIPTSIAVRDKVPEMLKDPSYFTKQGIRVFSGWGTDQQGLDPSDIDWTALGPGNFPFRLRQDPGPLNALGRVKFMFPNPFNVYLHDTPTPEVFRRAERDVSSGCIRLERPLELAAILLRDNQDWSRETLEEWLSDYQERTIRLARPWPVHLLHWTAWVDQNRRAHFRADLYGRDEKLSKALAGSLPESPDR